MNTATIFVPRIDALTPNKANFQSGLKCGKNQYTFQPHRIWPVSTAADSYSYFVRINTHISRIRYGPYLMRLILIKKLKESM
jgi:hypothetical protein